MKFNLAIDHEEKQAANYINQLKARKSVIEVKRVQLKRSINQNGYLHLLISAFAVHFGYSITEAKAIYKELNADIYCYEKKDRKFWRSSSELSKEEMAKTIDVFMKKSAENGCVLPAATNQDWLRQIENEIERSKYYLT